MTSPRIAIIYDDRLRPDTTGGYCLRALRCLAQATHYLPEQADAIEPGFDLYVRVDDDLSFRPRPGFRPAFFWAIDTHRNFAALLRQAGDYDLVFAAQKQGAERLRAEGVAECEWLPLACDPEVHRRLEVEHEYDVGFVGHVFPGPRQEFLEQVLHHFPRSFIGQAPYTEMGEIYSRSRVVINHCLDNDLNMRVFEALACGALLITNHLKDNGQEDLFQDRVHLVEYETPEEALGLIDYYLSHADERRDIAEVGHKEALSHHTYRHRMERMLERLAGRDWRPSKSATPASSRPASAAVSGRTPWYYRWPRPEVMELIPPGAERVLDVGCAAGMLGQELKRRQQCEVVGIELDSAAASEARTRLDEVVEGDVETVEPASLGRFDAVVCADVLEHLRDPAAVLGKLRGVLAPDGMLIVSVPNARHMDVVHQLIEGNWTYQPEGVLDRDHLRFFTRRSAEQLLEDAGFEVSEVRAVKAAGHAGWERAGRPGEIAAGRLGISGLPPAEAEEFFVGQWLITAHPAARTDWGTTSIIILTWNQFECTRLCLDSVRRHTRLPYELVIVDNGSTDGTLDWLRAFPDIRLTANRENMGFPKGANQGIRAAAGENILLLNNDTVVTPGWLRRLLERLYSAPEVGIVGPLTNYAAGAQQIAAPYGNLVELDGFAWELGREHRGESADTSFLVGFCLLTRREVLDKIGLLDERFGLGMFEDTDLSRRAREAGYRLVICRDAYIHHFGSRTLIGNQVPREKLLQENLRRFERKWSRDQQAEEPEKARPRRAERQPPDLSGKARPARRWHIGRHASGGLLLEPARHTISLCMIVRDEEAHIADCLKSVRPYVDEMIVVDTGSRDRTAAIARSLGAEVVEAQWQDSFSAARNISLEQATCDWIFWMDADDVLPPESGEALRRCIEDAGEDVFGFVAQVHCPAAPGEYGETVVDHVKLFRRRPDLRFELRIHEQILPSLRRAGGEIARAPIRVIHAHYDNSPAGQAKKLDRDRRLLELDLKEHPDHPFVHFNAGMTAVHEGDHERAIHHLRQSIALSAPQESHVRKAYALLAAACRANDDPREALEACEEGRALFPADPELLFNEGLAHRQAGDLGRAETAFRELLALPGETDYLSSLDSGILSFKARHNLAAICQDTGRTEEAEEHWRKVTDERPDFLPAWLALADVLTGSAREKELQLLVDQAKSTAHQVTADLTRGFIALRRDDLGTAQQHLREVVRSAPGLDLGFRYLSHALLQGGDREEAEAVLRRLIELAPDDPEAHHNLGCLLLELDRANEAVAHLQIAARLRPQHMPSHHTLQEALRRSQGSEEACR